MLPPRASFSLYGSLVRTRFLPTARGTEHGVVLFLRVARIACQGDVSLLTVCVFVRSRSDRVSEQARAPRHPREELQPDIVFFFNRWIRLFSSLVLRILGIIPIRCVVAQLNNAVILSVGCSPVRLSGYFGCSAVSQLLGLRFLLARLFKMRMATLKAISSRRIEPK